MVALLLIMIPSVILSWFYAFNSDFVALTLDATLVIAVTFLGSAFAATILPWWKKDLYQNSPLARMSVLGLPLVSIAGGITTIFLGWVLFMWITDPNGLYLIGTSNELDHLPGDPVRGRSDHLCRRTPLPANPGRRP